MRTEVYGSGPEDIGASDTQIEAFKAQAERNRAAEVSARLRRLKRDSIVYAALTKLFGTFSNEDPDSAFSSDALVNYVNAGIPAEYHVASRIEATTLYADILAELSPVITGRT